jgi:hypothetical protein
MKSKDIPTLIIIAVISLVLSIIISSKVFVTPSSRQQQVDVVPTLQTNFPVNKVSQYLSSNNVDPTVNIQINPINNPGNPYSGSSSSSGSQ